MNIIDDAVEIEDFGKDALFHNNALVYMDHVA